jgi:hypothetical protein
MHVTVQRFNLSSMIVIAILFAVAALVAVSFVSGLPFNRPKR